MRSISAAWLLLWQREARSFSTLLLDTIPRKVGERLGVEFFRSCSKRQVPWIRGCPDQCSVQHRRMEGVVVREHCLKTFSKGFSMNPSNLSNEGRNKVRDSLEAPALCSLQFRFAFRVFVRSNLCPRKFSFCNCRRLCTSRENGHQGSLITAFPGMCGAPASKSASRTASCVQWV